jgi:hypothetical protein
VAPPAATGASPPPPPARHGRERRYSQRSATIGSTFVARSAGM